MKHIPNRIGEDDPLNVIEAPAKRKSAPGQEVFHHKTTTLKARSQWVLKLASARDLNKSAVSVGIVIAEHVNTKTAGYAFPALSTIGKTAKLSKPTVIGAIRELEEKGYLTIDRSPGGRGNAHHYHLRHPVEIIKGSHLDRASGSDKG
jgi:DNA-binding MarR family transcriptional regulator